MAHGITSWRRRSSTPPLPLASCAKSLAIVGLAAGTTARQFTEVYGAHRHRRLRDRSRDHRSRATILRHERAESARAGRGRALGAGTLGDELYGVIAVDAYRPPYIPWHLTTREFFELVREHSSARRRAGHQRRAYARRPPPGGGDGRQHWRPCSRPCTSWTFPTA